LLLFRGILTRGGITSGLLYHNSQVVLGRGLIDAYYLESKLAKYPRIVISEDIVSNIFSLPINSGIQDFIKRDFDGLWHLELFRPLKNISDIKDHIEDLKLSRLIIVKLFRESKSLSLYERVNIHWLVSYFNESVTSHNELGIKTIIRRRNIERMGI